MDYNEMTPSVAELKKWARMTDGNFHRQVRAEIGNWATRHCPDERLKKIIQQCKDGIDGIWKASEYEKDCYRFDNDEHESMCKLTNLMLAAIHEEYGSETGAAIAGTL